MPSAYRELSYPLPIKGGDILRTSRMRVRTC